MNYLVQLSGLDYQKCIRFSFFRFPRANSLIFFSILFAIRVHQHEKVIRESFDNAIIQLCYIPRVERMMWKKKFW